MGVLRYNSRGSWCFCTGAIKSEKIKASIYSSKSSAMASISDGGTGFLIHRNLLLTTHVNIPSVAAAEEAEVRIHRGKVLASLDPHRFFITSSVLDLTMVGVDTIESDSSSQFEQQPHLIKTWGNRNVELGDTIYLLGHAQKKELSIGEGKVVIGTDNLIKLSAEGVRYSAGSAGFDSQGNLAFMVCDPMKLAKSPCASSLKSDSPMQFGIPIPIIRDWLHQHWEGNLDELSKPKLPLIRLMSSGQKSESFTHRHIFKPEDMPSSSHATREKLPKAQMSRGVPTSIALPLPLKQMLIDSNHDSKEDCCSQVMSNSSPLEAQNDDVDGFSSGEETMYSAETMESTNMPSPPTIHFTARKGAAASLRKTPSQSTSLPHKSRDYFSPTVSSTMKKRNSFDQPLRPRLTSVQPSPRMMMK